MIGTKAESGLRDERIIDLYFQRDERAIEETDLKYRKFLLPIAYNILHDPEDSEECLNDTYIDAWNSIPPARPRFLKAFLATIIRRRSIDRYKERNRQKRVVSELAVSLSDMEFLVSDGEDVSAGADSEALGRVISDFIRSLSDRRMYIFMCRYYAARPISEIAALLNCSESTVNKEIAAIKRDLRKKLEKEEYIW